jgi:hypothetical protein
VKNGDLHLFMPLKTWVRADLPPHFRSENLTAVLQFGRDPKRHTLDQHTNAMTLPYA